MLKVRYGYGSATNSVELLLDRIIFVTKILIEIFSKNLKTALTDNLRGRLNKIKLYSQLTETSRPNRTAMKLYRKVQFLNESCRY